MSVQSGNLVPARIAPSRRQLVASVALQTVGAVSALAVAFLISRTLGLTAQGRFGLLKGWTDVLVTLFLFGLPQSLLHYSYSDEVPVSRLRGFIRKYCTGLVGLALIGAVAGVFLKNSATSWIIMAVPGLVFHGLLRALLLRSGGVVAYSAVTIAPAVCLAILVGVLVAFRLDKWEWAIAGASMFSVLYVLVSAHLHGLQPTARCGPMPTGMWRSNLPAFVFNIGAAVQSAVLLSLMTKLTTSKTAAGELSFALYFLQIFAMFAGFVAPTLYDRYARSSALGTVWKHDRSAMPRLAGYGFAGLVIVLLSLPSLLRTTFPANYLAALGACLVMTTAGVALLANRLLATVLQVCGRFDEMGLQAIARLVLSVAGTVVLCAASVATPALSAAIAVLISEVLVLGRAFYVVQKTLAAKVSA